MTPDIIILLVVAVVIFLRLRSVLGKRTGNERPPMDIGTESARTNTANNDDNVVTLPRAGDDGANTGRQAEETAEDKVRDFMRVEGPIQDGLIQIAKRDGSFDPKHFVVGAKGAYEMIVNAFAEGNKRGLKDLLSADVYESFAGAIDERDEAGEVHDTNFIGINKADVVEAEVRNNEAQVTVKFVSQLITAIRNKSGAIIDGDPQEVREVTDIWTFARDLTSRDPNWRLVATQSAN